MRWKLKLIEKTSLTHSLINIQQVLMNTDGVDFPEEFLNAFDIKFIVNGDKNLIFK